MRAPGRHGDTHTRTLTSKHTCIRSYTHSGTRLGRQLTLAPTNSEEFVVIATVKWDDFTVSRNVSWPPCRYGNITRRRKRRWRERASEPSLHSSGLLLGTMSLQCPYFLPKTSTHTVTSLSNTYTNTFTQRGTHTLKSLSDTLSISPIPLIVHSLFSATALSSPGQFEFIMLNVNIGATTLYLRQVQLVEWVCRLSESVRSEKRGEKKRRGDQRHSAPLSVSLRCGESRMEQWGDYRLADYTWSNSAAAIHHNSIFSSVLPLHLSTLLSTVMCKKKEVTGRLVEQRQTLRTKKGARTREELSCFALLPRWRSGQSCSELTVVTAQRVAMGDSCQSITQSEGTDRLMITLD